jgi:hypothetical protein
MSFECYCEVRSLLQLVSVAEILTADHTKSPPSPQPVRQWSQATERDLFYM